VQKGNSSMNRRQGILAVLAAACGSGQAITRGSNFRLEFQSGPILGQDCMGVSMGDGTFRQVCGVTQEPQYALEVVYGSRSVKLTAKEIMDALEAKS